MGASTPEDPRTTAVTRSDRLVLVLEWTGAAEVDLAGALLRPDATVVSDLDFVFYNQPESSGGALRSMGRAVTEAGVEERMTVDLAEVGGAVASLAFAAALDDGTATPVDLRWIVLDAAGEALASAETVVTSGQAALLGGLRRSGDGWVVQPPAGFVAEGMAGVATHFGVAVEADEAPVPAGEDEDADETGSAPEAEVATAVGDEPEPTVLDPVDADPVDADPDVALGDAGQAEPGPVPARAAQGAPPAPVTRRRAVRTAAAKTQKFVPPASRLAPSEDWVPARLFSISGVGTTVEQEKRATSALMATAAGVKTFGRGLTALAGAPAGHLETFLEVQFDHGAVKVIPDAVIRVARGGRTWTALLEVKTGTGQLGADQVEAYLDVARNEGFDAVITLSNELSPGAGEHPVPVDKRRLRKVSLVHWSWAEVLHEAQMTLNHRGVADPAQAWVLHELVRYLKHPRSGASGFQDMGAEWVPVREAVKSGTLRTSDPKAVAVTESWNRLVRHLCLELTAELGVAVSVVQARKAATDVRSRGAAALQSLVDDGLLSAVLKVPGAAGVITVTADVRLEKVRTSVQLAAPREGGSQRRVSWLLRQVADAPDDVLVEVGFPGRTESTKALLGAARESSAVLLADSTSEVLSFRLHRATPMGTKRSGVKGAFIPSVNLAVEQFYKLVVQPLRAWVPPAPKLPEEPEPLPTGLEGAGL